MHRLFVEEKIPDNMNKLKIMLDLN